MFKILWEHPFNAPATRNFTFKGVTSDDHVIDTVLSMVSLWCISVMLDARFVAEVRRLPVFIWQQSAYPYNFCIITHSMSIHNQSLCLSESTTSASKQTRLMSPPFSFESATRDQNVLQSQNTNNNMLDVIFCNRLCDTQPLDNRFWRVATLMVSIQPWSLPQWAIKSEAILRTRTGITRSHRATSAKDVKGLGFLVATLWLT